MITLSFKVEVSLAPDVKALLGRLATAAEAIAAGTMTADDVQKVKDQLREIHEKYKPS